MACFKASCIQFPSTLGERLAFCILVVISSIPISTKKSIEPQCCLMVTSFLHSISVFLLAAFLSSYTVDKWTIGAFFFRTKKATN